MNYAPKKELELAASIDRSDVTTLIHVKQYHTDKTKFAEKIEDVDKKISDVSGLVTTVVVNIKIGEVENKIPGTSGLVTTTVLNSNIGEVGNKIPDICDLVKKTDYKAKISDIEREYFTTSIIINLRVTYLMQR